MVVQLSTVVLEDVVGGKLQKWYLVRSTRVFS